MTSLKNSVKLIGHLGADPEIKRLDGGKIVAKFSLATKDSYKNNRGEKVTNTQWHRIVAWGKTAEIIEKYTKKGTEVAVHGKLEYRNYEDKEGITRYTTEIVINEIMFFGKAAA